MYRIELDLTTVTPAFIGTADSERRAEWSAKGIRGQLRWWLRAVLGGELAGDAEAVRKIEATLFGSNERKSAVKILVRPVLGGEKPADIVEGRRLNEAQLATEWGAANPAVVERRLRLSGPSSSSPIAYLGYGPISRDRYTRARIRPGQRLHLLVQWSDVRPDVLPKRFPTVKDVLEKTLWCWIHLGGIGGRSRRGFGSLAFSSARTIQASASLLKPIATLADFEHAVSEMLAPAMTAQPPAEWSHFTSDTRIYVSTVDYLTWHDALTAAGAWLIAYRRRYGVSSDEREEIPDKRVALKERDYVWLKGSMPATGVPDRAGFGLPLPFRRENVLVVAGWRENRGGSRERHGAGREQTGRRASPLLIHVARFGDKHYLVFTHMPARLIPPGSEIHFHGQHGPPTPQQEGIVRDFLDDLESKAKAKIRRIIP